MCMNYEAPTSSSLKIEAVLAANHLGDDWLEMLLR